MQKCKAEQGEIFSTGVTEIYVVNALQSNRCVISMYLETIRRMDKRGIVSGALVSQYCLKMCNESTSHLLHMSYQIK